MRTSKYVVDTNIIIYLVTQSPANLLARLQPIIEQVEEGTLSLVVPAIVFAEAVFVLQSLKNSTGHRVFTKQQIASVLTTLSDTDGFEVESKTVLKDALLLYADKNVDFADAYLSALAQHTNEVVLTFDSNFQKLQANHTIPPSLSN